MGNQNFATNRYIVDLDGVAVWRLAKVGHSAREYTPWGACFGSWCSLQSMHTVCCTLDAAIQGSSVPCSPRGKETEGQQRPSEINP